MTLNFVSSAVAALRTVWKMTVVITKLSAMTDPSCTASTRDRLQNWGAIPRKTATPAASGIRCFATRSIPIAEMTTSARAAGNRVSGVPTTVYMTMTTTADPTRAMLPFSRWRSIWAVMKAAAMVGPTAPTRSSWSPEMKPAIRRSAAANQAAAAPTCTTRRWTRIMSDCAPRRVSEILVDISKHRHQPC